MPFCCSVWDFYETFGEDAIHASRILGITLTKRNNGSASSSELAGFPHHALDTYLHKLVKGGFRVAICDQLEDPKLARKGSEKRYYRKWQRRHRGQQDKC
jgi:DNA mismatch repair protein MutS